MSLSRTGRRCIVMIGGAILLLGTGFAGGWVMAAQPHMVNALHALERADHELQVAAADKAGHRANAMRLVSDAIGQVQAGIAAGAR
jgi:hypothetical protein